MSYYGTFDPHQEQWFPDEEEPFCQCPKCGCDMYRGEDGFLISEECLIVCEDCYDKWADEQKSYALIEIGED